MSKQQQFIAVVSLGGRVLHAVGPFATGAQAAAEGRTVAQGVDMFAPVDSEDSASVQVLELVANLGAMLPAVGS